MLKNRPLLLLLVFSHFIQLCNAQEKWDLRQCIDYALSNNISIKQAEVQQKLSEVQYKQSKLSQIPSLNLSNSGGLQFGRSIDPVTNLFTNQQVGFISTQLQTGVNLFNWFTVKNTVEANRLTVAASKAQVNKIKDDISLNIANAYLQALLSIEQMHIAEITFSQTKEQLNVTRKKVNAGALPELNAVELEAQLQRDSANVIVSKSNIELNLLQLKALLNMDAAAPFDIATPPAEKIPVETFADLQPDIVYQLALKNYPQQLANRYRLAAAKKNSDAAKGGLYPSVSAFGSIQSSFSSATKNPIGIPVITYGPTSAFVTVNGNDFNVMAPSVKFDGFNTVPIGTQFKDNFRQALGLSLQVPIFNGYQAKANWQRAKLNQQSVLLQMQADSLSLKQDIYRAYENAVSSFQTFQGRKKTVETSEYAYNLGKKRYDVGLLPTLDLLTLANNLQRARTDYALAQFDYIFHMKVLEFYKGQGLKL